MNKRIKVLVSAVLATVMLVLCIPFTAAAADVTATKITTLAELETGDYVIVCTAGKLLKKYDSASKGWVLTSNITAGDTVTAADTNVWTITVTVESGKTLAKITDANGKSIAPKTGNNNGIRNADYKWEVTVSDGGFSFAGTGSDTTKLALNKQEGKIRSYKVSTLTGSNGSGYVPTFNLYKVGAESGADCEHEYSDCADATCNKCDASRTAPGHEYDNCEDTTCNNCTAGNRTAVDHEYTNEYDAKCNNCTKTRTVTLPADGSTIDLVTADKIGAAQDHNTYTTNKYYVTGTVKTVGSTKFGNITIEDEDGNTFYLYTVKDNAGNLYEAVTENKPVVGAEATFYGPLGRYNSTTQMNPAVIYVKVENCEHEYTNELDATCDKCGEARTVTLPAADSTLDFATITKLGLAQGHNNYTAAKYYFVGTIKAISNTQYGNMTVEDEDGNVFTVYGSYDSTGATSFGEMAEPFKVGDKVKVYGIVGQFNGTAQIKNGWLTLETTTPPAGGEGEGSGTVTPPTTSPDTSDNVVVSIVVAVVALLGIAYVSKKH